MQDRTINYLELPARELARVEAFYSKVFGWEFTYYGDDYMSFSDAHVHGGFYRADLSSKQENGAALIVFYASDLEGLYNEVVEAGGSIAKEIFSFPGGRRFHFTDPAGNELAVWSDPVSE